MENPQHSQQKPKKRKLKIFKLTKKNFAAIGISPELVNHPYPFNVRILLGLLILMASVTCNLLYIICEAKTFAEYTQSIYTFSLAAVITLGLVIVLLNVAELFNLINGFENLVNASKLKSKIENFGPMAFRLYNKKIDSSSKIYSIDANLS